MRLSLRLVRRIKQKAQEGERREGLLVVLA